MQDHIKHGGIYLVTKDLYIAYDMHRGGERKHTATSLRKVVIPKGELLEFRYFSPAHFRDINNHYFPVDDSQLHKLEHVANILDEVKSNNIADLYDILRLQLYKAVVYNNRKANEAWRERAQTLIAHFKGVYTRL